MAPLFIILLPLWLALWLLGFVQSDDPPRPIDRIMDWGAAKESRETPAVGLSVALLFTAILGPIVFGILILFYL
jgi:hypothetical protein